GLRVSTGCSNRALRRNRNGQGSNRRWMKVQWQVTRKKLISPLAAVNPARGITSSEGIGGKTFSANIIRASAGKPPTLINDVTQPNMAYPLYSELNRW
ncbi:hypothetical protein ACFONQ_05635, partial [Aquibium oceanicum]